MNCLHIIADAICLPQKWRNWIVARYKRVSHWKPRWYSVPKEYGLNTCARETKITVSLTSYPARIKTVNETINTLLIQTVKPDRVVLWLAKEQFPCGEKDLPRMLLKLKKFGLTIDWCNDIKSYKKLIPSLKSFPEDIIITVDDDILYDKTLVERLLSSYRKMPRCIHSQLAMRILYRGGNIFDSYNVWRYDDEYDASHLNLLMGGSGTLYPPHVMPNEVFNEDVFMRIAPTVDDIWFWAMATLDGCKVCHIIDGTESHITQNPVASNVHALWNVNIDTRAGNDMQLKNIIARYPSIIGRLRSE